MSASHPLLVRLAALANPDGGWGYHAGKASHRRGDAVGIVRASVQDRRGPVQPGVDRGGRAGQR